MRNVSNENRALIHKINFFSLFCGWNCVSSLCMWVAIRGFFTFKFIWSDCTLQWWFLKKIGHLFAFVQRKNNNFFFKSKCIEKEEKPRQPNSQMANEMIIIYRKNPLSLSDWALNFHIYHNVLCASICYLFHWLLCTFSLR